MRKLLGRYGVHKKPWRGLVRALGGSRWHASGHELERLKRGVSLKRLIEGQGLKLSVQGKDLACCCPWHERDDTPSCIVSPKTNLWHCFGFDAGGSVIDWVMRMHKVSFRQAC